LQPFCIKTCGLPKFHFMLAYTFFAATPALQKAHMHPRKNSFVARAALVTLAFPSI